MPAVLRLDAPVFETVDDLRWKGPLQKFEAHCRAMGSPDLFDRATSAMTKAVAESAPGG